jgi:hypothetical protein
VRKYPCYRGDQSEAVGRRAFGDRHRNYLLVRVPAQDLPNVARAFLCPFAAVITFAIYRWERKNIAMCGHLRTWAHVLERDYFKLGTSTMTPTEHPHGPVKAPRLLRLSWGKTQAETFLYRAVIVSWLAAGVYTLIR